MEYVKHIRDRIPYMRSVPSFIFDDICYIIIWGDDVSSIEEKDSARYVEIGLKIADYRRRAGYTQEQLSEMAGITRDHLSQIERRNLICPLSMKTLFAIADALELPVKSFIDF